MAQKRIYPLRYLIKPFLKWSSIGLVGVVSYEYFNNRYYEYVVMHGFPRYIDNFHQMWDGHTTILKDFWSRPIMVQAYYCRPKAWDPEAVPQEIGMEKKEKKVLHEIDPVQLEEGSSHEETPKWTIASFLKKDLPLKIVTYYFKQDCMDTVRENFHNFCYLALKRRLTVGMVPLSWSEKVQVEKDLKTFSASWPSKEALKGVQLCAFTREADESITFDFPDNPEIPGFNIKNKIMADWWFRMKFSELKK
jgi:hypothetical protein